MQSNAITRMLAVFVVLGLGLMTSVSAQAGLLSCGGLDPALELTITKNTIGIPALRDAVLETSRTIGTPQWPEHQMIPLSVVELLQQVHAYKEAERNAGGRRGFSAETNLIEAAGLNLVDLAMIATNLNGKMIAVNQLTIYRPIVIDYQPYVSPGKLPYKWETGGPQGSSLSIGRSTNMRMLELGNSTNNLSVGPWLVGKNVTVSWSKNGDKTFTSVTGKLLNALNGDFTRGFFVMEINGEPYVVATRMINNRPANYQLRAETSKFDDAAAFNSQFANAVSGESLVPKTSSDSRSASAMQGKDFQILIQTPMGEKSVAVKSIRFELVVGDSPIVKVRAADGAAFEIRSSQLLKVGGSYFRG